MVHTRLGSSHRCCIESCNARCARPEYRGWIHVDGRYFCADHAELAFRKQRVYGKL